MNKYVIPVLIDEGTNKGWQPVVLSIKIIKSLSEISLKFLNWGDFCSMCQKPLHIFDWWKIIFFMGKLCYLPSICLKVHETHQSGTIDAMVENNLTLVIVFKIWFEVVTAHLKHFNLIV